MSTSDLLLTFDKWGLIPYPREDVTEFIKRAYTLVGLYEDQQTLKEIETHAYKTKIQYGGFWIKSFSVHHKCFIQFQKDLRQFEKKVGADLTWLPILGYSHRNVLPEDENKIFVATTESISLAKFSYHLLLFTANLGRMPKHHRKLFGCHEAFHAMRYTFDNGNDERTIGAKFGHLAGEFMFQSLDEVASNKSTVANHYIIFSTILKYYFGDDAFYVMARLSYEEMLKLFIDHNGSPISLADYLKNQAKKSLRHRIICLKLGL